MKNDLEIVGRKIDLPT